MAAMQGRKADTLAAVQDLAASLPVERLLAAGSSGWELTPQYAALVRFGLWDELIALGRPDARAAGLTAGYLYGRGVALAARGQVAEARTTLAELERLGGGSLNDLVSVAAPVVAARIAATELRSDDAIRELEKAAAAEDGLLSVGRTGWFFPVRHLLGAQLLIAGRARLPRGPEAQPRQRLGALRACGGAAGAGAQVRRRRERARARTRLESCRREAAVIGVLVLGAGHHQLRVSASALGLAAGRAPQASGSRVVNFLVLSTKLVLTERTAASCSSCVDRKCS
jgi:hypothetical protein